QGFVPSKMLVGEVSIVNGLCDERHAPVAKAETFHQGFKGAVISSVAEAAALKHVKRDGGRVARRVFIEDKAGVSVDETPYQPRRSHAINSRPWTRDPGPASIIFRVVLAFDLTGRIPFFQPAHSFFHARARRTAKEIDFRNLLKVTLDPRESIFRNVASRVPG